MRLEKILFYVVVSQCGPEFEYGVLVVNDMQTPYMIAKHDQAQRPESGQVHRQQQQKSLPQGEETIIPDPSYAEDAEQIGNGYDMANLDQVVQAFS